MESFRKSNSFVDALIFTITLYGTNKKLGSLYALPQEWLYLEVQRATFLRSAFAILIAKSEPLKVTN